MTFSSKNQNHIRISNFFNSKLLFLVLIVTPFISCNSVKKTQENLNAGNYVAAINKSLVKLAENKTKKGNQDYVYMLEDAFGKHSERELKRIDFLKKEGNSANAEKIYNTYVRLNSIQERIKPLLPLQIYDENRIASFQFNKYETDLINSKNELAAYLYQNATTLANSAINKYDYRRAYDDLKYLNNLSPNYKDTREKMEETYEKGLDYIQVQLTNNTDRVIPQDLEKDLLNFNTYSLNDLWTRYHTNPQENIKYNYEILLDFNNIMISPEQVNTKHIRKKKEIKAGWKYILDEDGNVAKDSLGNDRKEDKFKIVKCDFYRTTQYKDVQISGNVSYYDLKTNQQINSYPLASGFVFEHVHANYNGDKRALDDDMLRLADIQAIQFPTNEQMIYDSGQELKNSIKNIINRNQFK